MAAFLTKLRRLFFSIMTDIIVYFANADALRIGIANIIILSIDDA